MRKWAWWIFFVLAIAMGLIVARKRHRIATAPVAGEHIPWRATSRPAPMLPPKGKFDFTIAPAQRVDSVSPAPGQWVQILPGSYSPFTFPASGTADKAVHYYFHTGAIVDGAGNNVIVQGAEYLDIQGMTVRNADNGLQAVNAAVK